MTLHLPALRPLDVLNRVSLGMTATPSAQSTYGQAALGSGGVVLLPALVRLRGARPVWPTLEQRDETPIP